MTEQSPLDHLIQKETREFDEGYYTVQFSYIGKDDKEHTEIFSINEPMDFVLATRFAEQHVAEFGKSRIHSVFKNSHMKSIIETKFREGWAAGKLYGIKIGNATESGFKRGKQQGFKEALQAVRNKIPKKAD